MFLDGEDWRAMFRNFESEAWRLETLPQYLVPQEAEEFRSWRAGKRRDPLTYSDEYTEDLKRLRSEGKQKGRVHIVTRPLSEYLRFEFSQYYEANARAGDEIRILDVTGRPNPLEGVQDFWMFDRKTVVLMNYEDDGRQINREVYGGDPSPFVEFQQIALDESVPYLEYVKDLDL